MSILNTEHDFRNLLADLRRLRLRSDWHEDDGPVLWWWLPVESPPYCGTPLDTDWPDEEPTHWTPILLPDEPAVLSQAKPNHNLTTVLDCGCTVKVGWRCPMHGSP